MKKNNVIEGKFPTLSKRFKQLLQTRETEVGGAFSSDGKELMGIYIRQDDEAVMFAPEDLDLLIECLQECFEEYKDCITE